VTKLLVLRPSGRNLPAGLTIERWSAVVRDAASRWTAPCADVRVEVGPPTGARLAVEDGANVVLFRGDVWCHNEVCGNGTTFPYRALGMTTSYPEGAGSAARESDIELNGPALFAVSTGHGVPKLEVVVLHEIGHALGLEDACEAGHRMSGAPLRTACSAAERDRVMFAPSRRETLGDADVAELCRLYPMSAARTVAPPERPLSDRATQATLSAGFVLAATIAVCSWARRRRRGPEA
jgi:hypothetical protein